MGTGTLTRYSASAGSGKTFRLTSIYLSHLFSDRTSYRRILAVTFTNKATAEMKSRILEQLHILASGGKSDYLSDLLEQTGKSEREIRGMADEILHSILHDFSRFSICTIDTFFQKIIRAFARESGLHSGYNIELDNSIILSEAVDEMISSSSDDQELREWLGEFVSTRLGEEKSWDPRDEIMKLAAEIFREKFKILSAGERSRLEDKRYLLGYISKLRNIKKGFEEALHNAGLKAAALYEEYGLTDDMFYYKGRGVPGFIRALADGKTAGPNTYVRAALADPPKWSTKTVSNELAGALSAGLGTVIAEAVAFYDENIVSYNSAKEVLSGIYSLGILSDILKKVRMIASSENSFLIADAGELLRDITAGDQAPFIYEKIGNRYEHYMIDEFQDTSLMQWDNFFPLMEESMAKGNDSLVVGDIKQSIYRFRNSDWRILGSLVDVQIPGPRLVSIPLNTNWRSRSGIIRFNNTVFSLIPENVDRMFLNDPDPLNFRNIYSEAVQNDPGRNPGGYVRIEFLADDRENLAGESRADLKPATQSWQEKVLDRLPHLIEQIQDWGYPASDIGIIVRYGREGNEVLDRMIRYSSEASPEKRNKYNYRIVSDYSLTLSNSPAIIFIISTLRVLDNPADDISRAAMLRYFLLSEGYEDADKVSLEATSLREGSGDHFPDGFSGFMERTAGLPVFEAVENIIGFFGIGRQPWNTAYLFSFQDLVLNFQGKGKNDFRSFLDWWDTTGNASSVVLPAGQDAARIFTIHKSKGLEFKVVILPFLSWNDDHNTHHREIMWIRPPAVSPFDELGILPVRYRRNPPPTIFEDLFRQEKYSAFLDNLNLLYVALTRARDAMFGFAALFPDENSGISKLLREALLSERNPAGERGICPSEFYLKDQEVFEYGEVKPVKGVVAQRNDMPATGYSVSPRPESLKLKLHGESYFTSGKGDAGARINYGKLMHRAFEYIKTPSDVPDAVSRLVGEGLIPESESQSMIFRLGNLISQPGVSDWFREGSTVIREAGILLPSGEIKRPDRVVIRDGRTIVIDFKFGEESPHYRDQIEQYCRIVTGMGYPDVEGWLWYVDRNKTVKL